MTYDLDIKRLETRHWDVVKRRTVALAKACEHAHAQAKLNLIDLFNRDPFYENQLNDIAAEIRQLDPDHPLLPENNGE